MRIFIIFLSISLYLIADTDVSKKIEILGNPYMKFYKSGELIYARNIWDMQVFEGKLFLGDVMQKT